MKKLLIILLLIVGCEDSGTNSPNCMNELQMNELQVASCSELEELYELHQQAYNDYLNSIDFSSGSDEYQLLNENFTITHSCLSSSCPNSSLLPIKSVLEFLFD